MEQQYCPYCMSPVEPGMACPTCGLTAGAYSPAAHHLPPGTVLKDRYLIGRVLGEGGFGITYIGCDLRLELRVAIKEYFPTDKANRVSKASLSVSSYIGTAGSRYEEGKERFLQEARSMAKMDKQPVIVSVRDFFEENNTAYIVMEYVDGTTFKDLVEQKGGRIPAGELLHIMEPLFSALSAMHDRGLIHRDISPENLMLENGEIRLLDFGCAREAQSGDATLTIALKHGYAPVEQYQNKGQGPWTDVYALSATIYYCLTGRKPPQSMDRLVEDELILPRKLGVDLTERQERALLHGMGVRPRRRFQSVQELHATLYEGITGWEDEGDKREYDQLNHGGRTGEQEPPEKPEPPTVEVTQEKPGPSKPDRRRLWLGCAAGVLAVALILLAALHLWKKNVPDAPDAPVEALDTEEPRTEEAPGVNEEPNADEATAPRTVELFYASETTLRALLANDSISEVVLKTSILEMTNAPLEITKPLHIVEGCGINPTGPVTVCGGGSIRVDGELCVDIGMLRTTGGGTITVGSTGELSGCTIAWLERESDLTVEPGGSAGMSGVDFGGVNSQLRFPVVDEAALFADAVHVHDLKEFEKALNDSGTTAIVIDGDLTLSAHNWYHTVPVLISEGVTVTAGDSDFDFGSDSARTWQTADGTVLINRGTLLGDFQTGDWNDDNVDDICTVVNYGVMEGAMFLDCSGAFLNLGTVTLTATQDLRTSFYNLGTLTLAGKNQEENWLNFYCPQVCNYGTITVAGDNAPWMKLTHGTLFVNSGVVEIGANGTLVNESHLWNCGQLLVTDATARLDNLGYLEFGTGCAVLDMHPDSALGYTGLIQTGGDSVLNLSGNIENGGGHIATFRWGDSNAGISRNVSTEAELRAALADDACTLVAIEQAQITVNGDLTVEKTLAVAGTLTMNGGDLIVRGEDAFLMGPVDLGGGTLVLQDGAAAITRDSTHCGGVRVESGAMLVNTGLQMESGASVTLDDGHFINLAGLELDQAALQIESGVFRSCGWLGLSGAVEIGTDGSFLFNNADFCLEGTVTNRGKISMLTNHDGGSWELACDFANYGPFEMSLPLRISGSLTNYGTMQFGCDFSVSGTLNNQGTLLAVGGAQVRTEDGGNFTGSPAEARNSWTDIWNS